MPQGMLIIDRMMVFVFFLMISGAIGLVRYVFTSNDLGDGCCFGSS